MNQGARLDEILHTVEAPGHLLERPYLRPVYDEPEFVVRNIWRLYGGWYDGDPSSLKPRAQRASRSELASLAGGAGVLADRARALAEAAKPMKPRPGCCSRRPSLITEAFPQEPPELRMAGHLAEMAMLADPADPGIRRVHSEVFALMAAAASSTMAKGIYSWAATGSDYPIWLRSDSRSGRPI